jgi:hypothetical protein
MVGCPQRMFSGRKSLLNTRHQQYRNSLITCVFDDEPEVFW